MKSLKSALYLSALALFFFTSCQTQTECEHPTQFCCDFYLKIPAGFTGEMTETVYPDRKVTVTTTNCDGPFNVVITNADGTIEPAKTFIRGEAVADTMYIEQPDPPYDLQMIVETIHKATEVE